MKYIRAITVLALLLVGCEAELTRVEQCDRLHALQWCMANDGCLVTVDEVAEAKQLHGDRVCREE